jgi:hypothetical protein
MSMMTMRRQVESDDSSNDANTILGTEVVTGKPGIASESHNKVSTHSKKGNNN